MSLVDNGQWTPSDMHRQWTLAYRRWAVQGGYGPVTALAAPSTIVELCRGMASEPKNNQLL